MTLLEVKKGLLARMKEAFPTSKYKYYSMAVSEGFQRPCFFTQLKPTDTSPRNYNTRNMQAKEAGSVNQHYIGSYAVKCIRRLNIWRR